MYSHILIPTDGSDIARKGVDHGLDLAQKIGSKVTVLIVTEPYPIYATSAHFSWSPPERDIEKYDRSQDAFAQAALDPVRNAAHALGIEIDTLHVAKDIPSDAIVRTAEDRGCDLIVMASHGRRGLVRLLLGSQASQVLHHTDVPVLIVK